MMQTLSLPRSRSNIVNFSLNFHEMCAGNEREICNKFSFQKPTCHVILKSPRYKLETTYEAHIFDSDPIIISLICQSSGESEKVISTYFQFHSAGSRWYLQVKIGTRRDTYIGARMFCAIFPMNVSSGKFH